MGRSEWLHKDTVCLIDCVDQYKGKGDWPVHKRQTVAEEVQKQLLEKNDTVKPIDKILTRIATLGKEWTTDANHLALYRHGWAAMKERCSRAVLLEFPTGMYNPEMPVRIPFKRSFKQSCAQSGEGHDTSNMNGSHSVRELNRAQVSDDVARREFILNPFVLANDCSLGHAANTNFSLIADP